MSKRWSGEGPVFEILQWGGLAWTLKVDDDFPGLRADGYGPLLGLAGVSASGRRQAHACSAKTLLRTECRFERVEATYALPDWGATTVQATWISASADTVDLHIEVITQSVDLLRKLEVELLSCWPHAGSPPPRPLRWVEPRDARSAGLSYDGRESDLHGLTTLPPRESTFLTPRIVPDERRDGWTYVEMIHPDDVTRRIREGGRTLATAKTTRYGVFGYDLEKGVVLRARLRGIWIHSPEAKEEAFARMEQFLHEPPPLTT
jgi:hypothetical protein